VIAPVAGQLTARTSPRLPTVLGALLASGALFLLLDLTPYHFMYQFVKRNCVF
jgi:hypothetical protein